MATQSAKNIVAFYDKVLEQMNNDFSYANNAKVDTIDGGTLQNANNIYWRNVEQQAPIINGWDLTGQETEIIEQTYPLQLGDPSNDFVQLRVDELRDRGFLDRRAVASAKRQNAELNKRAAAEVSDKGSLYYESSSADFDFVAEADTLLTERQAYRDMGSCFFLTPRNNQLMAGNLASRTLYPNNRSEEAYSTGLIGKDVAGFDLYRAPTYGTVPTAAGADSTVASDVTEVPEGFTTVSGSIQNVDYRVGTVSLVSGANYQVGDVITFTGVNALGLQDKTDTGQLMTFKVVAVNGNDLSIYPKPIAANQAGITSEQAAYANISTAIVTGLTAIKVNANGGESNAFWANDSICVVNGDAPLETLNEFDGMKVVSETLDNGVKLYMAYDARLDSLNARLRLFTWYDVVNVDPSRNGVAIKI
jgi:hypothetical protein